MANKYELPQCLKCGGFTVKEAQVGTCPPRVLCLICGNSIFDHAQMTRPEWDALPVGRG